MSKKIFIVLLSLLVISAAKTYAQSADDVLRYSLEYPSYDPISLVVPAVSQPTGFGAVQENPAVLGLVDDSFFSFDLSTRYIDETSQYLGNSSNFSNNQTSIGELGFVYKVPTTRGSLVVGGGYSQTTDFNRAFSASGRNNQSTITDFYNVTPDDSLFFAAFDTYAIDFATTDSSFANTASIFRFDDGDSNVGYEGINQDVETTERGKFGEYSLFIASEVLKNFTVGASVGFINGSYNYKREFLESDRQNDYSSTFIDSDGDGQPETDIDNILSKDRIEAQIQAFSARLGFVYQPIENLNVAASYEFPSKLFIDEDFNTEIITTFDNGVQFSDDAPGSFSYKIIRPQRIKAGLTVTRFKGLTVSASVEAVQYSNGEIQFDEISLNQFENSINQTVRSSLNDVINWRGGLEYKITDSFTPRVGYAYFPSPSDGIDSARQFINGGFSAELTRGLMFDFGLQYSFWEDQNVLYSAPSATEVVQEDVTRLHVMVGIRMTL
jgi:long-subunit fatty acid transport protein